ncbi:hypothetical protein [Faecalibacter bovis]|uniref:Uncharacterized protein n=1 Tax=Faecalibacter bovis TaxID=2898187 RepID=A0ABX7XA02_9FLAO|nr:hypothetical protein [Faecalibacter bovis]QTV04722.1 hypothetical protein J9309_07865 [Faecalibacter bovis]
MKKTNLNNNKEFKIPTDYFASLEESILNETKRFEDRSIFEVPTDYFSDLEASILNSTVQVKKGKARQLWIAVSSVAACLLLFVVGYIQFNNSKEKTTLIVDKKVSPKVDQKLENDVYESLYKSYFVEEEIKKSSNDISLDDLDEFYLDQQLSSNY